MQEELEAHAYPSPQQPPPKPTGQAWELDEQASVVWRPVYVLVVDDSVVESVAEAVTTVVAVTDEMTVITVRLVEAGPIDVEVMTEVVIEVLFNTPARH